MGPKLIIFVLLFAFVVAEDDGSMHEDEKRQLREEAREMFNHAYRAYMENAYPADELMPLSCKGRYRGVTPNRGDMDDILGNFSLTLVDSLDTLVLLGDIEEFDHAVKLVIRDVSFDQDIVVSVFETNIRMLGGLLSAHFLALHLQQESQLLPWYRGELLTLAHDLGRRLLPAFNTSTGIPFGKVNLRHGLKGIVDLGETCTACAGTMILEMAALSRLTGEPVFEQKAHQAMDRLWKIRHRNSDLMGTVLNVHSGDWVRKDAGVGAGIDSYYEYCLKAYILLGDERYLARFNKHYNAVMKYISRGPMMLDVHMHRPHLQSRNFMDALFAFWPGLQVLLGDVRPAVETHEMLYQVMQKHTFIPEAFTTDFQVHWGQHPLRPEFLESTYFLYQATQDDHYLRVGKAALKALQKYTWVPCGYAAVNDVRTRIHEDRMDSFVLAETFKYLYLLFSNEVDLPVRLNEYILTTEAHLLPLFLASLHKNNSQSNMDDLDLEYPKYSRTCPNPVKMLPENVRKPLKDLMGELRDSEGQFSARFFKPGDPQHIQALTDLGISAITLSDGRVQLMYTYSAAKSPKDGQRGITFMREMAEMLDKSGTNTPAVTNPKAVLVWTPEKPILFTAGPSNFGVDLKYKDYVIGPVKYAQPFSSCDDIININELSGNVVIAERGDCTFSKKVRKIQDAGGVAAIIVDNVPGSSSFNSPLFAMSGDGADDINIPAVFIFSNDAHTLRIEVLRNPLLEVTIGDHSFLKNMIIEKMEKGKNKNQGVYVKVGDFQAHTPAAGTYVTVSYQPGEPNKNVFHPDVGNSVFVGESYDDDAELQKVPTEWFDKLKTDPNNKLHLPVDLLKELYNVLEKTESDALDQKRLLSWLLSTLEREKDSSTSKPTIISSAEKVHMLKSATSIKSEEFVISATIDQKESASENFAKSGLKSKISNDDIIQSNSAGSTNDSKDSEEDA